MENEITAIIFVSFITVAVIPATILGGMAIARSNLRLKLMEKRRMLDAYTELMREKLDVIKTAMAVGYNHDELRQLDERLEQLIGADKMRTLIDEKNPRIPFNSGNLLDADLSSELQRLQKVAANRLKNVAPDEGKSSL